MSSAAHPWTPVIAWLAGAALLCGAAAAAGHDPFHASTWARSDSGLYEAIARHGYEVHRCRPAEGPTSHAVWCGDTAWFPAYPLLLAAASELGLPIEPAGLILSWAAAAATLILLWRWFLAGRLDALGCAAFAPGLVYLYAVYPLSLFALAGVIFIRLLERDRRTAGVAGAAAALSYPLGLVVVPLLAIVQARHAAGVGMRVRRAAVLGGPALVAGAALVLAQRVQTGRWSAYFDVAGTYGGLHDPFTTYGDWLRVIRRASGPFGYTLAPVWQLLVTTLLLGAAAAFAVTRRRDPTASLLFVWCATVWFVPLVQTGQSLWRSEAGLVLLAPLLVFRRRWITWTALLALLVTAFGVAHAFFAGNLI